MPSISIYDHFYPGDSDYRDGVYRVVGTRQEAVTMLRVGNADGRRVNTGEIITVSYDAVKDFTPAENPDGNRSFREIVTSKLEMTYWSARVFVQQLAAHPILAAVAVTLVLAGSFGEGILPLLNVGFGLLVLFGSLGLAYVGSGIIDR